MIRSENSGNFPMKLPHLPYEMLSDTKEISTTKDTMPLMDLKGGENFDLAARMGQRVFGFMNVDDAG